MLRRPLLPHPLFTAGLILIWLLLVNAITPGHLLLGAALGVAIPRLTYAFWAEQPIMRRPGLVPRYLAAFLWDMLVANFQVARLVLSPTHRLRPAFLEIPLDLHDDFAITVFGSTLSLTPGTVSVDVSDDRGYLLLHCLDVEDSEALIQRVKARYEAPLKEIFAC